MRKLLKVLTWIAITPITIFAAWCVFGEMEYLSVIEKRPDGLYAKIDLGDMPFDQICIAHGNYGSLELTRDGQCDECTISKEGQDLIRIDEFNFLRLVVLHDGVYDVYPIEQDRETTRFVRLVDLIPPPLCARSAISVAKCAYVVGENCRLEFATFEHEE